MPPRGWWKSGRLTFLYLLADERIMTAHSFENTASWHWPCLARVIMNLGWVRFNNSLSLNGRVVTARWTRRTNQALSGILAGADRNNRLARKNVLHTLKRKKRTFFSYWTKGPCIYTFLMFYFTLFRFFFKCSIHFFWVRFQHQNPLIALSTKTGRYLKESQ